MKGFSRKELVDYYKDIVEKAWIQVEAAETPEVKSQKYDEYMDWTMLDKKYDDRTKETFGTGPVILPNWWWRYDPVVRPSYSGGGVLCSPVQSGGSGKQLLICQIYLDQILLRQSRMVCNHLLPG